MLTDPVDDYLAKPVKGKTLERMLDRWAINRRDPAHMPSPLGYSGSDCSEPAEHNCGTVAIPIYGRGAQLNSHEHDENATDQKEPSIKPPLTNMYMNLSPRPTTGERQHSHTLTLPGIENEGDRAVQRAQAEEKATSLRNDKLVEAAGNGVSLPSFPHGNGIEAKRQKLTVENIGRLDEWDGESNRSLSGGIRSGKGRASSSLGAVEGDGDKTGKDTSPEKDERPEYVRRKMDSEMTIKGL